MTVSQSIEIEPTKTYTWQRTEADDSRDVVRGRTKSPQQRGPRYRGDVGWMKSVTEKGKLEENACRREEWDGGVEGEEGKLE